LISCPRLYTIAKVLSRLFCGGRRSPSLWLGGAPNATWRDRTERGDLASCLHKIHRHLWPLTRDGDSLDWESRRKVFQSLRRSLLRRSVLLRLLPERTELEESSWGELLVSAFFQQLPSQRESMADRVAVFLEDLDAASGSLSSPHPEDWGMRMAIYKATRLSDQQFVALVSGSKGTRDNERRTRVFSGFNTPLLPEVLVCTQVGQEGIDLHRHCRHVYHYDLAWNPAVLEQRTGRADRIGSKTFRERDRAQGGKETFLEIGVPFLAGTYDERMYEELRLRAQIFEVLTGGDFAADNAEGDDTKKKAEGTSEGHSLVSLPEEMVNDLRVNLHVWENSM